MSSCRDGETGAGMRPGQSSERRVEGGGRGRMRSLGQGWGALIRVLIATLVGVACLGLAGAALADGITNSGDDLRTGWYPNEGSITPQLVSGNTFGQLWSAQVDGQVYAQPLFSPVSTSGSPT